MPYNQPAINLTSEDFKKKKKKKKKKKFILFYSISPLISIKIMKTLSLFISHFLMWKKQEGEIYYSFESIIRNPQEYITYDLVPTFPAVSRVSGSSNFDSFHYEW